jgi:hypothetical protein
MSEFFDAMETLEEIKYKKESLTVNKDNIQMQCEEIADLLIRKNNDYGNSVQEQFNEYGLTSILIRLDDKLKRLKSLLKNQQKVKDETIIDTLEDMAGYAVLGSICLQIKLEEKAHA